MTRTELILYRRRHLLWIVAALLFLGGAVGVVWLRLDAEAARAEQLAAEADRRGAAVSILTDDVRTLREQVIAKGGTPRVPDPADAVDDLPDRAEVPVPIPGPRGLPGRSGTDGSDGEDGKPGELGEPGADGEPGEPGADGQDGLPGERGQQGEPGGQGPRGEQGPPGSTGPPGPRGPVGPACPDGYSLQAPSYDRDALVCRRDGAPQPEPQPGPVTMQAAVLEPRRPW